ncbi:MAG TPA: hypothetical protein VKZ89_05780 [Thermobifida alba]|nr:hypothetical protein [Thermobifida alba]
MSEREQVIPRLQQLAEERRRAHEALMQAIREELDARGGKGLSAIARSVGWTPQYIGKIRDGKVGPGQG